MPFSTRKWGEVRAKIRIFLQDESNSPTWTNAELLQYFNWGLDDFTTYIPKSRSITYPSSVTQPFLPNDFYVPNVIEFPDGVFIEEIKLTPGTKLYSGGLDEISATSYPVAWFRDDEYIYLLNVPSGDWRLHYYAYYLNVETVDSLISLPRWAYQALVYFVASSAMSRKSVNAAQLDQWDTSLDSGKPTDNPLAQEAKRLMDSYLSIVYRHLGDSDDSLTTWRPAQRRR